MQRRGWHGFGALFALSLTLSACASANSSAPPSPATESQTLFPSQSIFSSNLSLFNRWTDVADRFTTQSGDEEQVCASQPAETCSFGQWSALVSELKSLPLPERVARANEVLNAIPYVPAAQNWGDVGYWETPYEFLARGGQCQDYAIAKYMALVAADVPERDLQFVVVRDLQRNLDHAILLVNVEGQQVVLDNQDASVEPLDSVHRYRAYYSISKTGWWAYIDRSPRLAGTQMADAR